MRDKDPQSGWTANDILNEIIFCEKSMANLYNTAALESSEDAIRKDFIKILTDVHQIQNNVFTVMERRGLYQPYIAEKQDIIEAGQKYNQHMQDFHQ